MYVPSTRKIISSYDVVFDESFSSALSYTSRPYSEAMVMRPAVTYTLYATSLKESIEYLINEDGDPTTPHKLATGTKPSVSRLCVFFVHVLYVNLRRTLRQRC